MIFTLLISEEMGFKNVQIEKPILSDRGVLVGLNDIYIEDINLVVNIDGPRHYYMQAEREHGKRRPLLGELIQDAHFPPE